MVSAKIRIILVLLIAGSFCSAFGSASAVGAEFNFIPPQQAAYWTPPTDFGKVSNNWAPPPGYERTQQPWSPPQGFTAPPKTWKAPEGWGTPPEWSPPQEFNGKVIREEIPKTGENGKQELEKPGSWE